jgi:hypothetical protein
MEYHHHHLDPVVDKDDTPDWDLLLALAVLVNPIVVGAVAAEKVGHHRRGRVDRRPRPSSERIVAAVVAER